MTCFSIYTASKEALERFTKGLAQNLAAEKETWKTSYRARLRVLEVIQRRRSQEIRLQENNRFQRDCVLWFNDLSFSTAGKHFGLELKLFWDCNKYSSVLKFTFFTYHIRILWIWVLYIYIHFLGKLNN